MATKLRALRDTYARSVVGSGAVEVEPRVGQAMLGRQRFEPADTKFTAKIADACAILESHSASADVALRLWQLLPASLGGRAAECVTMGGARLSHFKALMRIANITKNLVDVEGARYGKALGTADLAWYDDSMLVICDVTLDETRLSEKQRALEATAASLRDAGVECLARAMLVEQKDEPGPEVAAFEYQVDRTKIGAAIGAVLSKESAAAVSDRVAARLVEVGAVPRAANLKLDAKQITALQRMASEDDVMPDAVRLAGEHFPDTVAIAGKALSSFSRSCRGVPSSATGRDIDNTGPSWVAAIAVLDTLEVGDEVWFDESGISEAGTGVCLTRKTGKSFKIDHAHNYEPFAVLAGRIPPQTEARAEPHVMEPAAICSAYQAAARAVYAHSHEVREVPGIMQLACKVAESDATTERIGPALANKIAARIIHRLSRTCAGAALCATAALAMAQCSGVAEQGEYWYQFFDGRSCVVVSKRTGGVSERNLTNRLVCVRDPTNFRSSWADVTRSRPGWFISKNLLVQPRLEDWYSKAPAVAATKLMAYATDLDVDGTTAPDDYLSEIACDIATAALCARKVDSVRRKSARAIVLSNQSVIADLEVAARKFGAGFHKYATEALATARTLLRAAAVCTLRLTGTLKHGLATHYNRRKTSIATPVHARYGIANAQLVLNSLYDGHIGPVTSASFALSDAQATVELIKIEAELQKANGSEHAMGCHPLGVAAWRRGELGAYLNSSAGQELEVEYAVSRSTSGSAIGGSIVVCCAEADRLAAREGFDEARDEAVRTACRTPLHELMTLRKATAAGGSQEARELKTALENIAGLLADLHLALPSRLKGMTLNDLKSIPGAMASHDLIGMVLAVMQRGLPDAVFVLIAKEYSIEKARDIILLTASGRVLQAFTEKITAALARTNPGSAMGSEDKIAAIRDMRASLTLKASFEFVMSVATDKSGYGPTMNTAMFAAILERIHFPAIALRAMQATVDMVSRKRISLSARIMELSLDELRQLPMDAADIKLLEAAQAQEGFRCESGMGQGILQRFADLKSGLASSWLQRLLASTGRSASVRTTNDDGLICFVTTGRDAFHDTAGVCRLAELAYAVFGEKLNTSKLFASSYFAELNTCCIVHDEILFPWARQAASCANPCESPVLAESALHAMSIANGMVTEGAPAAACHLAVAIAWACHYTVHRLRTQFEAGDYAGCDPALFGAPVLRPFSVAAYGATAVRTQAMVRRGVPLDAATAYVVESCLAGALDPDAAVSWGDAELKIEQYRRLTAVSTRTFNKPARSRKIAQVMSIVHESDSAASVLEADNTIAGALIQATSGAATSTALRARHVDSVAFSAALTRLAKTEQRFSVRGVAEGKFVTSIASLEEVRAWASSILYEAAPPQSANFRELHEQLRKSVLLAGDAEREVLKECHETAPIRSQTARARPIQQPVDRRQLALVIGLARGGYSLSEQRAISTRMGISVYGAAVEDEPYLAMEQRFARARICLSRITGDGVRSVVSRAALEHSLLSKETVAHGYYNNMFAGFRLVPDTPTRLTAPRMMSRIDDDFREAMTREIIAATTSVVTGADPDIVRRPTRTRVARTEADVVVAALERSSLDFGYDTGRALLARPAPSSVVMLDRHTSVSRRVMFGPSCEPFGAYRVRRAAGRAETAEWVLAGAQTDSVIISARSNDPAGPRANVLPVLRPLRCRVAGVPAYACVELGQYLLPIVAMPKCPLPDSTTLELGYEEAKPLAFPYSEYHEVYDAAACVAGYLGECSPLVKREFASRCVLRSPKNAMRWAILRWAASSSDFMHVAQHVDNPALVAAAWIQIVRFHPSCVAINIKSLTDSFTVPETAEPLSPDELQDIVASARVAGRRADDETPQRSDTTDNLGVYYAQDEKPHAGDANEVVQSAGDRRLRAEVALGLDEDLTAGLYFAQCVAAAAARSVPDYEMRSAAVLGLADAHYSRGKADRDNSWLYATYPAMLVDALAQSRYAGAVVAQRKMRMQELGSAFRLQMFGRVAYITPDEARSQGLLGSGGTMTRIELERAILSDRVQASVGAQAIVASDFDLDAIFAMAIGGDVVLNDE